MSSEIWEFPQAPLGHYSFLLNVITSNISEY